ncbi:uncharacterized protein [Diadema setosum]|uniref:uncharacterized protein n=1 Tax=Diadema setosum TaxID=31175 RepID=UPI003B3A0D42
MASSILPLQATACKVVVRTLLDHTDAHSDENRRWGCKLVRQLQSGQFAAVSADLLEEFVRAFPSGLTNELLLLLAPPHLRTLNLSKCHNVAAHETALATFSETLSKCSYLHSLVLDEMVLENGFKEIADCIVVSAPQLSSISFEGAKHVTDCDIQILLMGLPKLSSLNLSMCGNITDNVFYLDESQLKPGGDIPSSKHKPGSNLVSVDLSGCQRLTNTCIRHLLELCGPKLRSLNVSCTNMDCTVLWYLSGYSLSTAVQLAIQSSRRLDIETDTGNALDQLLRDFKMLRSRLDEIEQKEENIQQSQEVARQHAGGAAILENAPSQEDGVDADGAPTSNKAFCDKGALMEPATEFVSRASKGRHSSLPDLKPEGADDFTVRNRHRRTFSDSGCIHKVGKYDASENKATPSGCSCMCVTNTSAISAVRKCFDCDKCNKPSANMLLYGCGLEEKTDSVQALVSVKGCVEESSASESMTISHDALEEQEVTSPIANDALNFDEIQVSLRQGAEAEAEAGDSTISHVAVAGPSCNGDRQSASFESLEEAVSKGSDVKCLTCSLATDSAYQNFGSETWKSFPNQESSSNIASAIESTCNPLHNVQPADGTSSLHLAGGNLPVDDAVMPKLGAFIASLGSSDEGTASQQPPASLFEDADASSAENIPPPPGDHEALVGATLPSVPSPVLTRLYEPNLAFLDITGIDFNNYLVEVCLEECFSINRHLQKLVLSHGGLTDSLLEIISRHSAELKFVSLFDCHEITNEGLATFLRRCPKLQHLDVQGLSHVGDRGLYPIFELGNKCQISVIKLTETCITDVTLMQIARILGPKLQELELLWCDDITDRGLLLVAQRCPSLQTLQLRQRAMCVDTLLAFAQNCPDLQHVGLSGISCVCDDVMETLGGRLRKLQTLDISWNSGLTNHAVSVILSTCPLLTQLLLMGLKQITEKPFLPIIANYSKWRRCQVLIKLKLREQKLRKETGMPQLSSDEEFEDLYVPLRSTSYAPSLGHINLTFCDHVNDNRLQEIVAVCRGTLSITDYYGEDIVPKLLHSS